ncbi:LysE family transporter [Candidatus Babeliales bacterium]|nr:LysE family transporter [Candidatus Babeliales bacterium]
MSSKFFFICYGVGILSTIGIGPIFILTFNRAATYGFLRGAATAFGSSLADAVLFGLGFAGFLSLVGEASGLHLVLDLVGGVMLILMGAYYFKRSISFKRVMIEARENIILIIIKSFLITIFNPGAILYFGYMSIQVSEGLRNGTIFARSIGIFMVFLGTLTCFILLSFFASRMKNAITGKRLRSISRLTGVLLMIVGIYFLYDFVIGLERYGLL